MSNNFNLSIEINNEHKFLQLLEESPLFAELCSKQVISNPLYLSKVCNCPEFKDFSYENRIQLMMGLKFHNYMENQGNFFIFKEQEFQLLADILHIYDDIDTRTLFLQTIFVYNHIYISALKPLIMKLIIDGINPEHYLEYIYTGFFNCICAACDMDVIQTYVDRYPNVFHIIFNGHNPIASAMNNCDPNVLNYLLNTEFMKKELNISSLFRNGRHHQMNLLKAILYDFVDINVPIKYMYEIIGGCFRNKGEDEENSPADFDALLLRCGYTMNASDIHFLHYIVGLSNPVILKHVINKNIFDLNANENKTLVQFLKLSDYKMQSYENYKSCLKVIANIKDYKLIKTDIDTLQAFYIDEELFIILQGICDSNKTLKKLNNKYQRFFTQ